MIYIGFCLVDCLYMFRESESLNGAGLTLVNIPFSTLIIPFSTLIIPFSTLTDQRIKNTVNVVNLKIR